MNINHQDSIGNTMLYKRDIRLNVLEVLLEHGANPNIKNEDNNLEHVRLLIKHKSHLNIKDFKSRVPLHKLS